MCDAETNGENTIDYILASKLPHFFVHELENSEDSDDDDDVPLAKLLASKANPNDESDDDTPLWKLVRKDFPTQRISTGTQKVNMRTGTQTKKSGKAQKTQKQQKQQKQVATVEQVAELFCDDEDFYDAPASTLPAGAGVIQVPSCTETSQAPASSKM